VVEEDSWYDRLEHRWSETNPELGLGSSMTAGRVSRLALLLAQRQDRLFRHFGLSRGEVGLLGALSAAGPESRLTPTTLMRRLLLSSAGVTSRLDRLERGGLVRRLPDPSDRRGVLVELTTKGEGVLQEAVVANARDSHQFLSPLTQSERTALDRTLRKLLRAVEPPGD
jgi:DNA-binding MarR family transcriptional regulator